MADVGLYEVERDAAGEVIRFHRLEPNRVIRQYHGHILYAGITGVLYVLRPEDLARLEEPNKPYAFWINSWKTWVTEAFFGLFFYDRGHWRKVPKHHKHMLGFWLILRRERVEVARVCAGLPELKDNRPRLLIQEVVEAK